MPKAAFSQLAMGICFCIFRPLSTPSRFWTQWKPPDDMLETFSELAVEEPDLMRLVRQASVVSLVNTQSAMALEAELKRRAMARNQ